MKVAFAINNLGLGGAETALLSWVSEIATDLDVCLITESTQSLHGRGLPDKVRVLPTPTEDILVRIIQERPDTFVVDIDERLIPLVPGIRKRVKNLYCIIHSISPWSNRFLTPALLAMWDKVILISPLELPKAVQAGIPESKLVVIENLIRPPNPTDRKTVREALNLQQTAFVFGYAGRADSAKRVAAYPLVLAGLRERGIDAHLLMIGLVQEGRGPRTEFWKANLKVLLAEAKRLQVSPYLHWLPPTPDMSNFYGALDAGLLLSMTEGSSMFLAESLFAGIPFVSTDVGDAHRWCLKETGSYIIENQNDTYPALRAVSLIANRGATARKRFAENAKELMTKNRGIELWRQQHKPTLLRCLQGLLDK